MVLSFAGVTGGLVLFGFAVSTNIWTLSALFFISRLTGFGTFGGNLLTMVPPSNWFFAKPGRAIVIGSSGMLLGTVSFALLAALLIETLG